MPDQRLPAGPVATIVDVTPKLAEKWLLCNAQNRPLRDGVVARYVRDMKAGRWLLNGDPIRFDRNNDLIDGQHRLNAVVISGVTISTFVTRGLEPQSFTTLDQQSVRRAADYFAMRGMIAANVTESAAAMVWRFENNRLGVAPNRGNTATVAEILDTLERHDGILDSQNVLRGMKAGILRPKGAFVAFHYLMSKSDREKADEFFRGLKSGTELSETNPVYHLRERLITNLNAKEKMSIREKLAITIKAWNAFKAGDTLKVLRWITRGRTAEPFPGIS